MNEQELDKMNKRTNGKTDKQKVSNLKKSCNIRRLKHVNGWHLSKSLKNEKAFVLSFSGASSKQTMTCVKTTIEDKPDFIILHTGTNDLRSNADPEEIANSIIDVAVFCKEYGWEVIVSAILPQSNKLNEKGTVVNEKTKELCLVENIYFLEHRKFNPKYHLNGSQLHPTKSVGIIVTIIFM